MANTVASKIDNKVANKRANYAIPLSLFPSADKVTTWSKEGDWTEFERFIRAQALAGYQKEDAQDKELARFMVPALSWEDTSKKSNAYFASHLKNSWIASGCKAPFIPQQCYDLVAAMYSGPRSGAHLVGATFTHLRIVYLADSQEVTLDDELSPGSRELLIVIAEPEVKATLKRTTTKQGLYARSVIGSIGQGAEVTVTDEYRSGSEAVGVYHDRWYLADTAQLKSTEVLTGGKQTWLRKEFVLAKHAQVDYRFLSALKSDEQVALTTVQEHQGSASTSSVLVKTALSESSRSFYRGTIAIDYHAGKSEADQQQRALMLSPHARTCAIPSLEVATHDVQCQHGSAAGKFDAEELWYLQSRGLPSEQAQALLLEGFFNEPGLSEDLLTRLKNQVRFS